MCGGEGSGSKYGLKMAAHFGLWEVNFPSSRAVDFDDDDDEEDTERQAEPLFFEWSPSMQKELGDSSSFNCSLLIVGVDEVASTFLEAHYLTAPNDTVGLLTAIKVEGDFATTAKSSHVNKGGVLHRLTENPSVVVCLVNGHVPQEKAFSWTEKVRLILVLLITTTLYQGWTWELSLTLSMPFFSVQMNQKICITMNSAQQQCEHHN